MTHSLRRTFAGLVLVASLGVGAGVSWYRYSQAVFQDAQIEYQEQASHRHDKALEKLNAGFKSIYENTRMLAALPGVKAMTRDGGNITPETGATFQEVYHTLSTNVDVSVVYAVPATGDAPVVLAHDGNDVALPKRDANEDAAMKQMSAYFQANVPRIDAKNKLNIPMISGVITTGDAKDDRAGVMFAVPVYGADNNYRGMVTTLILNSALRDLLVKDRYALVNASHAFSVLGDEQQFSTVDMKAVQAGEADPALAYSAARPVSVADARSTWVLWAGQNKTEFMASVPYQAAKNLSRYGFLAIALFTGLLAAFWLQTQFNVRKAIALASKTALSKARDDNAAQALERTKQALEAAAAPYMMTDRDGVITDLNASANALAQHVPDPNVTKLIGQNISRFGIGLEYMLQTAGVFEVAMGDKIFRINRVPMASDVDGHSGTLLEWNDITAQIQTERQIAEIVRSASSGDFAQRIDMSDKHGFLLELSRGVNELTATMEKRLDAIMDVISGLASGDLARRVEGDFKGAFKVLKTDVNFMADTLANVVKKITDASLQVESTTQGLTSDMSKLAYRSTEQATALAQTSAAVEHFTSTLQSNAAQANEVSRLATAASGNATDGSQVAVEAMTAVGEIQHSSKRIGEIIALIQEITFQTNILSLNAAVEAARAGEAGKGFAVVASEVRALALRASEASESIKKLVADTGRHVEHGVKLVNQAGNTLNAILSSTRNVEGHVFDMAQATIEQSSSITQVGIAISHMDELTQQNADMVQQSNTDIQKVNEKIRDLKAAISFFRLNDKAA
jgi:methyl-accepting chemotaxis protein